MASKYPSDENRGVIANRYFCRLNEMDMKGVLLVIKENDSDLVLSETLKQKLQLKTKLPVVLSFIERRTLEEDLTVFAKKKINHLLVIPVNFATKADYKRSKTQVKEIAEKFEALKLDFINDYFSDKEFLIRFSEHAILNHANDVMFKISTTQEINNQVEGLS